MPPHAPGSTPSDPRRRPPVWLPAVGLLAFLTLTVAGWWFAPDLTPPDPPLLFQQLPAEALAHQGAEATGRAVADHDLTEPVPEETPPRRDAGFDAAISRATAGRRFLFADRDRLVIAGGDRTEYPTAALTRDSRASLDPRSVGVAPGGRRAAALVEDSGGPPGEGRPPRLRLLVVDLRTGAAELLTPPADRDTPDGEPFALWYGPAVSSGDTTHVGPHWLSETALVAELLWQPNTAGVRLKLRRTLARWDAAGMVGWATITGLPDNAEFCADGHGPLVVRDYGNPTSLNPRLLRLDADGLWPADPEDQFRHRRAAAAEQATYVFETPSPVHAAGGEFLTCTPDPARVWHVGWPLPEPPARQVEVLRLAGRLVRRFPPRPYPPIDRLDPLVTDVRWDPDLGLYRWTEREPDGGRPATFVADADGRRFRRWHPGRYVGPVAAAQQP